MEISLQKFDASLASAIFLFISFSLEIDKLLIISPEIGLVQLSVSTGSILVWEIELPFFHKS